MTDGGVWRTVGGRRIFIKDGEDLQTAMKRSGKFKNLKSNDGGFKPLAKGSKTFEEHGVAFNDDETNKRFSDYLRDRYGTDDIDMITTGSEKTAESLRDEFNQKSYEQYVKKMLSKDEYLKANRPNEHLYKMVDSHEESYDKPVKQLDVDKPIHKGKSYEKVDLNSSENYYNLQLTKEIAKLYNDKQKGLLTKKQLKNNVEILSLIYDVKEEDIFKRLS